MRVESEEMRIQPLAPAIGLIVGGVFLVVCSLLSNQWLETSAPHFQVGDKVVRSIGLLGDVTLDDIGMRSFGMQLMIAAIVLLVVGMVKRWALYAVQVATLLSIGAHSWWVFSEREAIAGPGFVLGILALALVLVGTTMVLMRPRALSSSEHEVGETIDGLKHGRWHIYNNGKCIAIEEWNRGELISSQVVR